MPPVIVETTKHSDTFVLTLIPQKEDIEMFDQSVRPTNETKSLRENMTIACSFCHKSRKNLLICSKVCDAGLTASGTDTDSAQCKVAAYCSREVRRKKCCPIFYL